MYFHIEIVETDTRTQGIFAHETVEEAVAAFHYALFYQMNNIDCKSCLVMVMDEFGNVLNNEKYVKPVENE